MIADEIKLVMWCVCVQPKGISSMFMVGNGKKNREKSKKNVMEKSINNWAWTNLIITLKFSPHEEGKKKHDQIKSDQKH